MAQQVKRAYLNEFLALKAAGASDAEAIEQIAISNQIALEEVFTNVYAEAA